MTETGFQISSVVTRTKLYYHTCVKQDCVTILQIGIDSFRVKTIPHHIQLLLCRKFQTVVQSAMNPENW